MIKSYRVAGHVFSFVFPEGHPLWGLIGQYKPFELPQSEPSLFSVELVDALPSVSMEKVYGGDEEPGQPVILLYRGSDGWAFEMAPCPGQPLCGRVYADRAFTHARLHVLRPSEGLFALNNATMLMFAFRTATLDTLEMHASVVVNAGKAFLWLAKSGTGKSTHSQLWLDHVPGSRLLNDDNPVVRVMEDGHTEVFGTPWSGKTPCYKNEHYPAGAFSEIVRSPENRITRKSVLEAYALLYSSSSGFKADPAMSDGLNVTYEKILRSTPCFTLECRPDADAARVSSETLLAL